MKIIKHRVNKISELLPLQSGLGAEFDVRSRGGNLILNHEPHTDGDSLDEYLAACAQKKCGTLAVNPKEDGLQDEILRLLAKHQIDDFFFLDLTLPTTVKMTMKQNVRGVAMRVSEYEDLQSALHFKNLAQWVWLDVFTGAMPSLELAREIKKHFQVCLVSPELQGYSTEKIVEFKKLAPYLDAVCTKHEKLWL